MMDDKKEQDSVGTDEANTIKREIDPKKYPMGSSSVPQDTVNKAGKSQTRTDPRVTWKVNMPQSFDERFKECMAKRYGFGCLADMLKKAVTDWMDWHYKEGTQ